MPRVMVLIYVF